MAQSNVGKNRGLDATILATDWVALHTADPGTTGGGEVAGGGYARQTCVGKLSAASSGTRTNSGPITFADLPASTVTHFGIWDSSGGGNFVWGGSLSASKTVGAGDTVNFGVGQITATYTT